LNFRLDQYEGPLDLLLDMIRRQQIDIRDIPIAKITSQYLAWLDNAREMDLDVGAEFVFMAATLIHIKSRMLLPTDPALKKEGELEEDFAADGDDPGLAVSLFDLVKAFGEVLEKVKSRPTYEITEEEVTVSDMVKHVRSLLSGMKKDKPLFIMQVLARQRSRRAMICLFLAVLEMVKMQTVLILQKDLFGEIALGRGDRFDETVLPPTDIEEEYK
jgi:segregation and condensation protein A